jgi:hypothetical protein
MRAAPWRTLAPPTAALAASWISIVGLRALFAVVRDTYSLHLGHGLNELATAGVLLTLGLCAATPFVVRGFARRSGSTPGVQQAVFVISAVSCALLFLVMLPWYSV